MVAANAEEAADALDTFGAPYVVKDDGLAAGKGVVVTNNRDEALAHAQTCFDAGGTVVIEEFLDGPEVSVFVLCDGRNTVALSPAQDFKRIFDNDEGPNTGGMGAYTPLEWAPRRPRRGSHRPRGPAHGQRDGPPRHPVRGRAVLSAWP